MARISKEQKELIRQDIVRVAGIKFQELGFDGVSTKEIAKEVGIAEGTLFNYFDSKTHLFLEAFGEEVTLQQQKFPMKFDLEKNIVDILYDELLSVSKMFMKLPKGIMSELMIASIKLSKKHPKAFERFVQMDLKYIENTKDVLDQMIAHGLLQDVDTKQLSELVYSIMMYEFIMYLYDKDLPKDTMLSNIKTKLSVLLQGYIK